MRVTSELYVQALMRRASAAGAFATIVRRGAASAGAIFICVRENDAMRLFGPAMAGFGADEVSDRDDRRFALLDVAGEPAVDERIASEARFDADLWVVEIEDAQGRSFLDDDAVVAE